jgi:hypothetical protein
MKKIIIYGAETQAQITLIRALKRAKLKTLILAKSVSSIGRYSICAHEVLIMPSFPPTEEYLSNLITKRKISHIITTDLRDSIYLQKIKSRGMLGNAEVIEQNLELLNLTRDKISIRNLFLELELPFAENQVINSEDNLQDIMASLTYPIQFFDNDIDIKFRKIHQATNFISFEKKVKKILQKKHSAVLIDKKFYTQHLHQDCYLLENEQINHSWHTYSFLSFYDKLSLTNTISVMPTEQRPDQRVDFAILEIAKKLGITKDAITISYFKNVNTHEIYYVDLYFGGTLQMLPLLQKGTIKFIESRLKIYGLKYIINRGKPLKKALLYISGTQKFQSFISINDFYTHHKHNILSYLNVIPVLPLLDADDLNPLICLTWRFIKTAPIDLYFFIKKKLKKMYIEYTIAQNRKKFEQYY